MLIVILDILTVCLSLLFVISQIICPSIKGRSWFPMFRKKRKEMIENLEKSEDDLEIKQLQEKYETNRKLLKTQRKIKK